MSLVSVMLLQRNVPRAATYYSLVGFRVAMLSDSWAELEAGAARLLLKRQEGCSSSLFSHWWLLPNVSASIDDINFFCREAQLTTGYSPFLNVEVADLQNTVEKLLPLGAQLDGPIRFIPQGKVAAIRNPDGHMMSLYEIS